MGFADTGFPRVPPPDDRQKKKRIANKFFFPFVERKQGLSCWILLLVVVANWFGDGDHPDGISSASDKTDCLETRVCVCEVSLKSKPLHRPP